MVATGQHRALNESSGEKHQWMDNWVFLFVPLQSFLQLCHLHLRLFFNKDILFQPQRKICTLKPLVVRERAEFNFMLFLCHIQQKNQTQRETLGISVLQTRRVTTRIKGKSTVEKVKKKEGGQCWVELWLFWSLQIAAVFGFLKKKNPPERAWGLQLVKYCF